MKIIKVDGMDYRVSICEHTKKRVLQIWADTDEWLCLHNGTAKEDEKAVKEFLKKYEARVK